MTTMTAAFEFLKHPLKIIESIFEAPPQIIVDGSQKSNSVPAVVSHISGPEGICGWVPSEVGNPDWVCQIFGSVMPGIVFFVSLSIFSLTVFFLLWYVRRYRKITKGLQTLLTQLKQDTKSQADVLSILKSSGIQFPPVRELVRKIEGSFLISEVREKRLAKSVAEISKTNMELSSWTGQKLANEIPSWLTAMGLLTTFIAILLGLQHVKVMSNLEVQGIGGLVNGLSGKFFSSITALACSLFVTIIHYFLSERLNLLWLSMIYKLETLLPHASVEQMLLDMVHGQKQQKPNVP